MRALVFAVVAVVLGGCSSHQNPAESADLGPNGAPSGSASAAPDPSATEAATRPRGPGPGGSDASVPAPATSSSVASASASVSAGPPPTAVTFQLKSECPDGLTLFFGERPKKSIGTNVVAAGRTTTDQPRAKDGTAVFWIVDKGGEGVSSARILATSTRAVIGLDCRSITVE